MILTEYLHCHKEELTCEYRASCKDATLIYNRIMFQIISAVHYTPVPSRDQYSNCYIILTWTSFPVDFKLHQRYLLRWSKISSTYIHCLKNQRGCRGALCCEKRLGSFALHGRRGLSWVLGYSSERSASVSLDIAGLTEVKVSNDQWKESAYFAPFSISASHLGISREYNMARILPTHVFGFRSSCCRPVHSHRRMLRNNMFFVALHCRTLTESHAIICEKTHSRDSIRPEHVGGGRIESRYMLDQIRESNRSDGAGG
jgi:hypothetical protein